MGKLKPLSASELIKILSQMGFGQTRQKGSHIRFAHSDGRKVTVPMHPSEDIGIGLLNKIIKKEIKISREEFEKYL